MADTVKSLGRGKIYAIDLFSKSTMKSSHGNEYYKVFDSTMQPYTDFYKKIEGNSQQIPWDLTIDFLFIDGDHSEIGVSKDIIKYTPFVRSGGYIFLHDYVDVPETNSMVKTAIDKTLMQDSTYKRIGVVSSLIAFKKN